jgi:hypothetical protein
MAQRLELQALLTQLLGSDNVYFQPPPTTVMSYPCIVYHRDYELVNHADDKPYKHGMRYLLTVIDRNPDSSIIKKISDLPMCSYDRFYTSHNLNHDVFKLFY